MAESKCRSCRYEQSDCKGVKSIDTVRCDYFKEKLATNYPAQIRELEAEKEKFYNLYKRVSGWYDTLYEQHETLEAENSKLRTKIEERVECGADCEKCEIKCRAWQNGYNATCERECDNCEVIADMQSLKNVLEKLMFDYADDLRGDTE